MSAWIAASSAPGTLYSSLAGMIMAAMARRSLRCACVSASVGIASSVKQIGKAVLHLIGDVERDGLNGGGRIDAARGDEHATVDDEQILHVVRATPFVHYGALGIGAHARRAEQMPAAIRDRAVDADVGSAGGGENFPAPRESVLEHFPAVFADGVVDARRRNAV